MEQEDIGTKEPSALSIQQHKQQPGSIRETVCLPQLWTTITLLWSEPRKAVVMPPFLGRQTNTGGQRAATFFYKNSFTERVEILIELSATV